MTTPDGPTSVAIERRDVAREETAGRFAEEKVAKFDMIVLY